MLALTLNLHAPQIILLVIIFVDITLTAAFHGNATKVNIWIKLFDALVLLLLLSAGGFFS